ncbi:hypothetical protein CYLTODRAFT_421465 [Cylindrobasidium torrendii FP15055 ss-10]|uniref:PPP4R2-domain-containing protein n=1 Tax=Cylindrobasidium torrendii FP15055 ss-10 TaxID=1314674 RepID=A0A0D7BDN0_9AGAR|nr:hypothetical protein CYLTODRAFT_421465 [Cylindrobasidium torrendii FP15055 ss-10]
MTFVWKPEYDEALRDTESEIEWPLLREILKHKLAENVSLFLSERPNAPALPAYSPPQTFGTGGLKLPPFPPRQQQSIFEVPVSYMNKEQADEMRLSIDAQLDAIDDSAPFTVQRVCELCLEPMRDYKAVGKYLRAVEKALLVTSSLNSFPPATASLDGGPEQYDTFMLPGSSTAPPTPMFSPIPFLHEDARRSKSRSPPPSPLVLPASGLPVEDSPVLGMVDELDDPGPGHMSDHPTALSSTTSISPDEAHTSKGMIDTLEQRFVKAKEEANGGDAMDVDVKQDEGDTKPSAS